MKTILRYFVVCFVLCFLLFWAFVFVTCSPYPWEWQKADRLGFVAGVFIALVCAFPLSSLLEIVLEGDE